MKIANRLKRIERARDQALATLGRDVRDALVKPACKRYGLRFRSGNGTYAFFRKSDNRLIEQDDAKKLGMSLGRVFRALDAPVGDTIGSVTMGEKRFTLPILAWYVRDVE